jgi:GR25 family glycosyltransferase involved in LPS biosynthesis
MYSGTSKSESHTLTTKSYDMVFSMNNIEVYLINMSTNKDRLDHFVKNYKNSDLASKNFYRLEAIKGSSIKLQEFITQKALDEISFAESNGHRTKHYQLSKGGVGCYLSHMMIYKQILQSNRYFAYVFEDDVIMNSNIFMETREYLRIIPGDWDIILLGCDCIACDKVKEYSKVRRFFYTHGMLVNKKGIEKIVKFCSEILIEQQIDAVLSDMAEKNIINIYCINDAIAKQSQQFHTTIQVPVKNQPGVDPYAPVESIQRSVVKNNHTTEDKIPVQ